MSHSLEFLCFKQGDIAPFDLETLRSVLGKHGCRLFDGPDGDITVRVPDSIGGEDGLIAVKDGRAASLGIGRPRYDAPLKALTFDLLSNLGLCVFPSSGEEIYSVSARPEDVPQGLLDTCEKGLQIVTSPEEL